ncbi:MAG TPA: ECF-type sigma factor [Terriglobales bacterium]|jgi:RNA polymerase sigma factor (TIGR02999 family)|nr:ECF-type sigma factor [Terriglobales bacterium]
MGEECGEITLLLRRWQNGDKNAEEQLFQLLLPELRKIAGCCFRRERSDHTLQPTAILNEAFLRLAAIKRIEWQNRGQFLAIAARVMRRLLIDYARSRPTVQFAPLEQVPELVQRDRTPREVQIELSMLLDELESESPLQRTIVDLKNVLGLTDAEVAEALGIPVRTVQREWHDARVWLFKRMSDGGWKPVSSAIM